MSSELASAFHPWRILNALSQHVFRQFLNGRVPRVVARFPRADPSQIHFVSPLDLFHKLDEVTAVDVEVRINTAVCRSSPPPRSGPKVKKLIENGLSFRHVRRVVQPMSAFHP